jgi:hypothetical protein
MPPRFSLKQSSAGTSAAGNGIASLQTVHNRHVPEAKGHKLPEKMRQIHINWLSHAGRAQEFLKCQNHEYVPAAAWRQQCTCIGPVDTGSVVEHEVSCNAHTCLFWMSLEKGCNVLPLLQYLTISWFIIFLHFPNILLPHF